MSTGFEAIEYVSFLHSKWRFIALTCGTALAAALVATLLLPKQYTATTRIVIEPPGGDQHVTVAVSPIYLEELRTYEHFASSDSLFLGALEHFGLRDGKTSPVESWKRKVLRVEVPRNTKILNISATLPDPVKAHALALYLAQETVALSRTAGAQADSQLIRELESQSDELRAELERTTAEWNAAAASGPTEGLMEEIREAESVRAEVARNISAAEMLIAEDAEREKLASGTPGGAPGELETVRMESRLARSRLAVLRSRDDALDKDLARKRIVLSQRAARQDALAARRKAAEAALAAARNREREVRAAAANRGEQLNIIDPGIVPERPSSPNPILNVTAALFAGLLASVVYISFQFGWKARKRQLQPAIAFRSEQRSG